MKKIENFEEKTIERTDIFDGSVIHVFKDIVALPEGGTASRELVFHQGSVAIIPITIENKIVMVKQFRKPLEKTILEIPAGKIDPGEQVDPRKTANRELEEETAYRTDKLIHISSMYMSPGFSDELLHIYYTDSLEKVDHPLLPDEDELIELHELTLTEAKEEIKKGTVCDAKTIFAIQYWEHQHN